MKKIGVRHQALGFRHGMLEGVGRKALGARFQALDGRIRNFGMKGEGAMGNFRELIVWQRAKDLAVFIYKST